MPKERRILAPARNLVPFGEALRKDLVWLDCREGVPGQRYRLLWTEAEDRQGNRMPCVTYIAEGSAIDRHQSLRYIKMLREGARAHNLPEHWLRFLESVKHAE